MKIPKSPLFKILFMLLIVPFVLLLLAGHSMLCIMIGDSIYDALLPSDNAFIYAILIGVTLWFTGLYFIQHFINIITKKFSDS